ncbi:uncharacterized protein LOC110036139 isoform X2 [Phalaenopsis equestris]|uniref:uncharacterized protein LOC110036139 isoform X2 n=1 Tax=Phalaenopsis equestris TaxID=78828 RepID=UPI0009E5FE40|nr:uncharacterized protein LOC110036139 isoform X2 [Phalaenopsis equestris]
MVSSMVREWYWSRSESKEERERPGCMRGMFHFFDFHHLHFTGGCRTPATATSPPATGLQYRQLLENQQCYDVAKRKGIEAPRNSLELEESDTAIREDYFGVPISIQIAHPSAMAKKKKIEEEKRTCQAVTPRTRSIVARLMGLESLHDEVSTPYLTSYESSSAVAFPALIPNNNEKSKEKKRKTTKKQQSTQDSKQDFPSPRRPLRNLNSNISGSISLPETPRASSERPRDTEPRHSLQHNKENNTTYTMQELSFLRDVIPVSSTLQMPKKDYFPYLEGNKTPTSQHFTREIVKHMKSNMRKREGGFGLNGGHERIVIARKNENTEKQNVRNNHLRPPTVIKPPPTCSSPKARFSEPIKKVQQHPSLTSLPSTKNLFKYRVKSDAKKLKMEPGKCRKTNKFERFPEKVIRQAPQLCVFGLQTEFLQPADKVQELEDPEFKYVKAILTCADVVEDKSLKCLSSSLRLDRAVFDILERWFPFFEPVSRDAKKVEEATARLGPLRHRWNRKLVFHLVEEILGDLLLLGGPKRLWRRFDSKLLLSRLWSEIKSYPSADCRVVGDIDALVFRDLPESKVRRLLRHPSVVAEVQDIISEIQRDILDSLLGDTAASLFLISSSTAPKAGS